MVANSENVHFDWELTVFRLGVLACVAWAVFIAIHFQIAESVSSVWYGNFSSTEIAAANRSSVQQSETCLAEIRKTAGAEYAPNCFRDEVVAHGIPRDRALSNIEVFLASLCALLIGVPLLIRLGMRMARQGRRARFR